MARAPEGGSHGPRRLLRGALAVYAVAGALGLARFALRDAVALSEPAWPGLATPADLGSAYGGARVAASSYDAVRGHYPTYLVDDEPAPTWSEQWAPDPRDAAPWLELRLPRVAHVGRITLWYAGAAQGAAGRDRYRIRCGRGRRTVAELAVDEPPASSRHHDLDCPGVNHVSLHFDGPARALWEIDVVEVPR